MTQIEWLSDQKTKLYQSEDWRKFIELYWPVLKRQRAKINYAELSRKANYSSRAYLFEVLKGKKKISLPMIPRLSMALKLKGHDKKLFYLLAKKEVLPLEANDEILDAIANLKKKLLLESEISNSSHSISEVFSGYHVYSIYAALGSPSQGATLDEIRGKTKISDLIIKQVLERFIAVNCVVVNQDRYYLTHVSLDLKELGSNINFKETFVKALDEIKKRALKMEQLNNDFYFHTAFPIRKGTQQSLKEKLRECILDFVESNDEGSGDEIVHINLSAYRD